MTVCDRFGAGCAVDCCCIAAWAAILEADSVVSVMEAVGNDGSKNPCEWCRGRCLGRSAGCARPDGRLLDGSLCGMKEATGRMEEEEVAAEEEGWMALLTGAAVLLILVDRGGRGEAVPWSDETLVI